MKTKLTFLIALLALTVACKNETTSIDPQKQEEFFVKAVFLYSDGSQEETRIRTLRFDNNARVNQNLVVDGTLDLNSGDFGVITIRDGANLTLSGSVSVANWNWENTHEVKVIIGPNGNVSSGPLNLDGKVVFTNKGKLLSSSVELQGGSNTFINNGTHTIIGDLQSTTGGSKYYNTGYVSVTNATNLHSGEYEAADCGSLITSILNINGSKKVSGKGFIKVTGNINLNGFLTDSPNIELCYTGVVNQKDKLGSAKLTCEPSCKPDALPLRYSDLKVEPSVDKEGNWIGKISFQVLENTNVEKMKLLVSSDGLVWTTNYTEHADAFKVGERYSREFFVRLK